MSSDEEYLDSLLKSMGGGTTDLPDGEEDFTADIDAMFAELEQSGRLPDPYGETEEKAAAGGQEEPESEPEPESVSVSEPESVSVSGPEPVFPSEPEPVFVSEPEPVSVTEPEPVSVSGLEPVFSSEPEPGPESTDPGYSMDDMEELLNSFHMPEEAAPQEADGADHTPTVEGTQSLDQEEIENMLAAFDTRDQEMAEHARQAEEEPAMDAEEADILALLDSMGEDDSGANEIGELLKKSDHNEAVDDSIFEQGDEERAAEEIAALLGDDGGTDGGEAGEKNRKRKKEKPKKERRKKEKVPKEKKAAEDGAESENGEPKAPGFFGRLFSKLTEEEDAGEENENIMKELEAEDAAAAGKKKKRKKGLMPKKKGKDGDEEEEETGTGKKGGKKSGKKEKPKKAAKPRKEKAVKEPAAPEKPSRKISKASIAVMVLFAATVFGIVFMASVFLSGMLQKQRAEKAFDERDYLSCYEELYGMDLSAEEEEMFQHARTVLKVERRLSKYEKYLEDFQIVEALDVLMQALADYDGIYAEAQSCGAEAEVNDLYERIYGILERDYGLSREEAHAIANCEKNVDYTRYLTALAAGEEIPADGGEAIPPLPEDSMQDILPEEEELHPPVFLE